MILKIINKITNETTIITDVVELSNNKIVYNQTNAVTTLWYSPEDLEIIELSKEEYIKLKEEEENNDRED